VTRGVLAWSAVALLGLAGGAAWLTGGPVGAAVDMVTYAQTYAWGHVQAGLWTVEQGRRHVLGTVLGWLPVLLVAPLLLGMGVLGAANLRRCTRRA
jgi:hypothetical protein